MTALAYLLGTEWGMGNGQCPACKGMGPVFEATWVRAGLCNGSEIGHKQGCPLAASIAEIGGEVRYMEPPA